MDPDRDRHGAELASARASVADDLANVAWLDVQLATGPRT